MRRKQIFKLEARPNTLVLWILQNLRMEGGGQFLGILSMVVRVTLLDQAVTSIQSCYIKKRTKRGYVTQLMK